MSSLTPIETRFIEACRAGNLPEIQSAIAAGVNLDRDFLSPEPYGRVATALYHAAENNHLSMLQALLTAGAKVDLGTHNGETPLHVASSKGHVEVVQTLLAWGANLKAQDRTYGETALHEAVQELHLEVVSVLLAAGADVNVRTTDVRRQSVLDAAVDGLFRDERDDHRVLKMLNMLLEKSGEKVSASTLYWATLRSDKPEVLKILLAAGADPNLAEGDFFPLHNPARNLYFESVKLLLAAGAAVDRKDSEGRTALWGPLLLRCFEMADLLLSSGADPSVGTGAVVKMFSDYSSGPGTQIPILTTFGESQMAPPYTESKGQAELRCSVRDSLINRSVLNIDPRTIRGAWIQAALMTAPAHFISESGCRLPRTATALLRLEDYSSNPDKNCRTAITNLKGEFRGVFTKVPKGVAALAELLNRPANQDIRLDAARIIEAAFARKHPFGRSSDAMAGYQRIYAMLREDGIVPSPSPATGAGAPAGAGSGAHAPGM